VQLPTSILHGVRTPSSIDMLMCVKLNNSEDIFVCCIIFAPKKIRHQHLLEEKFQIIAFILSQNKISNNLL
jgi:hypothetical protein